MAGPAGSGGQKMPHHSLVVSGIDGSHIVTQRSTNGTPCPHDHCWHSSWKNATQMPANDRADYGDGDLEEVGAHVKDVAHQQTAGGATLA